jgi:ubiquinone/menaquinone biosynthesis C-methylase UbiE
VYASVLREFYPARPSWLDVGCGHEIFGDWLPSGSDLVQRSQMIVGLDYDLGSLKANQLITNRIVGDICALPCREGSFDLITANMVMEHVADPVKALSGIERLLKPNGLFIFHTPNYWHYSAFIPSLVPQGLKNNLVEFAEGREENDVFPTFYRFNDVVAIERTARDAGLAIRKFDKLSCSWSGAIMLLGPFVVFELLFRRLTRWKRLENFRANFVVVLQKPDMRAKSTPVIHR